MPQVLDELRGERLPVPNVGDFVRFQFKGQQVAGRVGAKNGTHLRVHFFFRSTKNPRSSWVAIKDATIVPRPIIPGMTKSKTVSSASSKNIKLNDKTPRICSDGHVVALHASNDSPANSRRYKYTTEFPESTINLTEAFPEPPETVTPTSARIKGLDNGDHPLSSDTEFESSKGVGDTWRLEPTVRSSTIASIRTSDADRHRSPEMSRMKSIDLRGNLKSIESRTNGISERDTKSSSVVVPRLQASDSSTSKEEISKSVEAAIFYATAVMSKNVESRNLPDFDSVPSPQLPSATGVLPKLSPATAAPLDTNMNVMPQVSAPGPSDSTVESDKESRSAKLKNKAKCDLTLADALAYFQRVKGKLQSDRHAYTEFLKVMRDMKERKTETSDISSRIRMIFRDHPALLVDFNAFLPKEHRKELERHSLMSPQPMVPAGLSTDSFPVNKTNGTKEVSKSTEVGNDCSGLIKEEDNIAAGKSNTPVSTDIPNDEVCSRTVATVGNSFDGASPVSIYKNFNNVGEHKKTPDIINTDRLDDSDKNQVAETKSHTPTLAVAPTLESLAAPSPESSPSLTNRTALADTNTSLPLSSPAFSPMVNSTLLIHEESPRPDEDNKSSFDANYIISSSLSDNAQLHEKSDATPSRLSAAVASWEITQARDLEKKQPHLLSHANMDLETSGMHAEAAATSIQEMQAIFAAEKTKHTQERLRLEEAINVLKDSNLSLENGRQLGYSRNQTQIRRLKDEIARLNAELTDERAKNADLELQLKCTREKSRPVKELLEECQKQLAAAATQAEENSARHLQEKKLLETTISKFAARAVKAGLKLDKVKSEWETSQNGLGSRAPKASKDKPEESGQPQQEMQQEQNTEPSATIIDTPISNENNVTPSFTTLSIDISESAKSEQSQDSIQKGRQLKSWPSVSTTSPMEPRDLADEIDAKECEGYLLKKEKSKITGAERWVRKRVVATATHLEYYALGSARSYAVATGSTGTAAPTTRSRKRLNLSLCRLNEAALGPDRLPTFSLTFIGNPSYTISLACETQEEFSKWLESLRSRTMTSPRNHDSTGQSKRRN